MSEPIHIISLGAGVQSSTMALMAACGEITPMPTAAIFADTQAEPASVYRWLDWLEKQLPFPVIRVGVGSLEERELTLRVSKKSGKTYRKTAIPAFGKKPNGQSAIISRKCTTDHKIIPLVREALNLMRGSGADTIIQWIGISLDEVHRMKPSRDPRIVHRWPLVDSALKRHDCLRWMETRGFPKPPRSACRFCPYHGDAEWRRLKAEEPEEFELAAVFEEKMQEAAEKDQALRLVPFLHRSCTPLRLVDFSSDFERGQGDLFGNECEGMCGV